jgi:hypothetical protein
MTAAHGNKAGDDAVLRGCVWQRRLAELGKVVAGGRRVGLKPVAGHRRQAADEVAEGVGDVVVSPGCALLGKSVRFSGPFPTNSLGLW